MMDCLVWWDFIDSFPYSSRKNLFFLPWNWTVSCFLAQIVHLYQIFHFSSFLSHFTSIPNSIFYFPSPWPRLASSGIKTQTPSRHLGCLAAGPTPRTYRGCANGNSDLVLTLADEPPQPTMNGRQEFSLDKSLSVPLRSPANISGHMREAWLGTLPRTSRLSFRELKECYWDFFFLLLIL